MLWLWHRHQEYRGFQEQTWSQEGAWQPSGTCWFYLFSSVTQVITNTPNITPFWRLPDILLTELKQRKSLMNKNKESLKQLLLWLLRNDPGCQMPTSYCDVTHIAQPPQPTSSLLLVLLQLYLILLLQHFCFHWPAMMMPFSQIKFCHRQLPLHRLSVKQMWSHAIETSRTRSRPPLLERNRPLKTLLLCEEREKSHPVPCHN